MTSSQFREVALTLPNTVEASHAAHPDFRTGGRVFATLGYPDDSFGVLLLTPDQQRDAIAAAPQVFTPVAGAWGRKGNTQVILKHTRVAVLRPWMQAAWQNASG